MIVLALITTGFLTALAVLHALWLFEIWVPFRDERRLVASVVGFGEATRMPGPIPCGALVLSLVAVVAMIWMPQSGLREFGLAVACGVFAIRGALAYVPRWRRLTPQQPFARNDVLFYGPLCLALAVGVFILRGWAG